MAFTPNRLESQWERLGPLILQEWNLLTPADLDFIEGRFDRLVEVIRQRYGGRIEIIQEAALRDTLNQILDRLAD